MGCPGLADVRQEGGWGAGLLVLGGHRAGAAALDRGAGAQRQGRGGAPPPSYLPAGEGRRL